MPPPGTPEKKNNAMSLPRVHPVSPVTPRVRPKAARAAGWAATLAALAACHPADPGSVGSTVGTDSLLGHWSLESRDDAGNAYAGVLDVKRHVNRGVYAGDLEIEFTTPEGIKTAVIEDALISIEGAEVLVRCARPVVVTENGEYNADNFLLRRMGPDLLRGMGKDSHSVGGTITLTRRAMPGH